jgi:transposase InsO family protein
VFHSVGMNIVQTPFRTAQANAVAERWIRSIRQECLDHIPILREAHLRRVLTECVAFHNVPRPHQRINQLTPTPNMRCREAGLVTRRDVLGGVIHNYCRLAA